ncbi:hypothetical protein QU847_24560, partial [Escherichia coli]|nr:hypothetical protein [Escherichia coli]MDM8941336.1 hypothetical protein [Escherichia coli]MDM8952464.1 hypothetical protein [Escherichia coli]MDM8956203.1 hypothetical protein [Escherichia coli]MDM8961030.1 hypothetical protein [Escherichia coli]
GCNPAYSKSIHTWLRFGEIMRGSLSTLSGNQSYCDKSSASKVEITSIVEKSILSAKPSSITHPGVYGSVANGC